MVVVTAMSPACSRRQDVGADASTTSAELERPPWTFVPAPAPVADASIAQPEQRPLDNAPRPAWVPDAATLTVVEASDLARNLGLEPPAAPTDGGAMLPPAAPTDGGVMLPPAAPTATRGPAR